MAALNGPSKALAHDLESHLLANLSLRVPIRDRSILRSADSTLMNPGATALTADIETSTSPSILKDHRHVRSDHPRTPTIRDYLV